MSRTNVEAVRADLNILAENLEQITARLPEGSDLGPTVEAARELAHYLRAEVASPRLEAEEQLRLAADLRGWVRLARNQLNPARGRDPAQADLELAWLLARSAGLAQTVADRLAARRPVPVALAGSRES